MHRTWWRGAVNVGWNQAVSLNQLLAEIGELLRWLAGR